MSNAYMDRMNQLNQERVKDNAMQLSNLGLPIQRPNIQQNQNMPTGNIPKPEEPSVDESYKDSPFFANMNRFKEEDPQFGGMMEELTQLSTGLRQMVEQGFMPPQIAQQKVMQYIKDTQDQFVRTAPQRDKEMKEKQQKQMQEQLLGAVLGGQPQQPNPQDQEIPPEGVPQEQMIQQMQQQQAPQTQGGM